MKKEYILKKKYYQHLFFLEKITCRPPRCLFRLCTMPTFVFRLTLNVSAHLDESLNANAWKKWMMITKYKSIGTSSLIFSTMPGKLAKSSCCPLTSETVGIFELVFMWLIYNFTTENLSSTRGRTTLMNRRRVRDVSLFFMRAFVVVHKKRWENLDCCMNRFAGKQRSKIYWAPAKNYPRPFRCAGRGRQRNAET